MVDTLDALKIFEVSPTPTLIVKVDAPQYTIVGVNLAFKEVTNLQEEDIIGLGIFEAFPSNPHDLLYSDCTALLKASFDRVIETKRTDVISFLRYDIPIRGTDKFEVRYWQPKNIPVLNDQGEVDMILHTAIDITESAKSSFKLEASEIRYKDLVQSMNAIIWEADAETYQYTYVSPQAIKILGYEVEAWYGKGFWENHVHPEDKERVLDYSLSMVKQYKDHVNEFRMIAKDRSVVWISDAVSVGVLDGGHIKLRGVMTDITTKKLAEKTASENRIKFEKILENSLDIICSINEEGKFVEVSAASESILGYKPEEMIGLPFKDFVYPDDKDLSVKEAKDIINGDFTSSFENRYIHKDGSIVYIMWSAKWDDHEKVIYCIAKDGTYKKKIEQQLLYNEQRFKNLVQHGADFIAILDQEGTFNYASLNAESILGYTAEYMVGTNAFTLMHKDDLQRVHSLFLTLIKGEKIIADTFRYKNGEGKYQWMETIAIDMRDNPAVGGIVINSRDVTEKKHYLEWHEYVNKATNNAIYDWDLMEDRVQWGGYTEKIFDTEELKDFHSNIWEKKLHREDRERVVNDLKIFLDNPESLHWNKEYRFQNSEQEYLDIIEDGYAIRNDAGKAIRMIGALRDITERKRFETELKISNQRYSLVTQATSDAIWDWDLTNDNLYWGDGFKKIFGHQPEEQSQNINSWTNLIHPKDYNRITKGIHQAIDNGSSTWEDEYLFRKSCGEYVYVYDRGFVHRDANGMAIRMVGAMQNIHQDKMKELNDEIKLSISKIFTAEISLEASFSKTLKILVSKLNCSYGEIWMSNVDRSDIALLAHYGKGIYTIDKAVYKLHMNQGIAGWMWKNKQSIYIPNIVESNMYMRKDFAAQNGFNSVRGYPIIFNDEVIAIIKFYYKKEIKKSNSFSINPDILNLLGSEMQRKKAEIELNLFFDLSPDFLCIVGMDGRFIKVNQKFERVIGPIQKDGNPLTYHEYTHPDDLANIDVALNTLRAGKTSYNESRYRTKSGEYIWVGWDTALLIDQGILFTIGKDITERKKQENDLAKSNAKLSETLESIQDGFFALDFDWKVTYWNREAERLLGAKREEVLGKNIWNSFPDALKLRFFTEYKRAMFNRVIVNFEEYFPPLDIWFSVSAFPSDGGITVYFKDVTASKNESLKLLQFKNVIENSKDEIAIISTVNESIYLNPAYTASLGFSVELLQQRGGPQAAFANEDLAAEVFSTLLSGQYWKGDVELINKDRKLNSYHISGGPIFDDGNKLIAVFLIHTNISERRHIENKLKILYGDIKRQAKDLADSQKEMEHFALVASNNVQMPLVRIKENLSILKEEYLQESGQRYIDDALNKSDRLQLLMNGLVEYTQLGSEALRIDKVDLNEVIEEINKELRDKIIDKFAILELPKMPVIKGNKVHFHQIFKNLIINSLTYCDKRPRIILEFDSSKTHWVFSITDNGTGFDPSYVDRIFNLFQTIDDQNLSEGTGMGLAITKKLVEKYKGNIWVDTEPSVGSSFHFTISKDL